MSNKYQKLDYYLIMDNQHNIIKVQFPSDIRVYKVYFPRLELFAHTTIDTKLDVSWTITEKKSGSIVCKAVDKKAAIEQLRSIDWEINMPKYKQFITKHKQVIESEAVPYSEWKAYKNSSTKKAFKRSNK